MGESVSDFSFDLGELVSKGKAKKLYEKAIELGLQVVNYLGSPIEGILSGDVYIGIDIDLENEVIILRIPFGDLSRIPRLHMDVRVFEKLVKKATDYSGEIFLVFTNKHVKEHGRPVIEANNLPSYCRELVSRIIDFLGVRSYYILEYRDGYRLFIPLNEKYKEECHIYLQIPI